MKLLSAILIAVTCGAGVGAGAAVLKFRQYPWKGGMDAPPVASGGQVEVEHEDFDFGKLDFSENGKHEFVFTNRGNSRLTLNLGTTSCSCTVSEIKDAEVDPGQSTKVTVTWRSKGRVGHFQQSVTIVTSDPRRPEVTLTVKGEFTRSVYADPEELTFGQMAGNEPIVREARILCTLPNQKIAIQGHTLSDPSQETFFQVDCLPLSADELRKYQGAMSGVLIRVTVKPGLPLGRFQQRITLKTDVETAAEVDLPVFGSVGDITLVGPGWSSETGVLDLGMVDGHSATQRQLIVLARGVNAKEMQFKIASVEPDFLKARLGKTTAADTGDLSKTELLIEIPERKILEKKSDLNGLGANKRNFGEIVLETTGSQVRSLRIRVRFAVVGGTEKEKK